MLDFILISTFIILVGITGLVLLSDSGDDDDFE